MTTTGITTEQADQLIALFEQAEETSASYYGYAHSSSTAWDIHCAARAALIDAIVALHQDPLAYQAHRAIRALSNSHSVTAVSPDAVRR